MDDDAEGSAPEPARELQQVQRALDDARLLAGGGSIDGSVNRLYYACFHAARAALYDRGEVPTSYGGVRTLFGKRIVLEGDAPRELGRLLRDPYDYRMIADYEGRAPDVDLDELTEDVDRFVAHVAELV